MSTTDTMNVTDWAALTMPEDPQSAELLAGLIVNTTEIEPDTVMSRAEWDALYAFRAGVAWENMRRKGVPQ